MNPAVKCIFDVNKVPVGENNVSFVLQSGAPTRSGEVTSPVRKGFSVELGQVDDQAIYLEETITDFGYSEPETKGTPLYTENLGYLYRDKLGVHTSTYTAGDVVYQQISEDNLTDGKFWCYGYDYPTNIWGDQTTPVDFAFYMPANMTSRDAGHRFRRRHQDFQGVSQRLCEVRRNEGEALSRPHRREVRDCEQQEEREVGV